MSKRSLILAVSALLVLAVAVVAFGGPGGTCNKSAKAASAAGCCTKDEAAKSGCCEKSEQAYFDQLSAVSDEIPLRENARMTVTGTAVCGHCDLGKTDRCQPMVKTADGKLYALGHGLNVHEMKNTEAKNGFSITGRVKEVHGVSYLEVTSFRPL